MEPREQQLNMAIPSILTLEEVAKIMKVSQKTVYRWVQARRLRAARFGHKTYRVREDDLKQFIRDHFGD